MSPTRRPGGGGGAAAVPGATLVRRVVLCVVYLVVLAVYVCFGAAVMHNLENDAEAARRVAALNTLAALNITTPDHHALLESRLHAGISVADRGHSHALWTFSGACLYCVSVLTTVGYGAAAPATADGKVFTLVFFVPGVCLLALTVVQAGRVLAGMVDAVTRHCGGGGRGRGGAARGASGSTTSAVESFPSCAVGASMAVGDLWRFIAAADGREPHAGLFGVALAAALGEAKWARIKSGSGGGGHRAALAASHYRVDTTDALRVVAVWYKLLQHTRRGRPAARAAACALALAAWVLAWAGVLSRVAGWGYADAAWFTATSALALGVGDIRGMHDNARLACAVCLVPAVALAVACCVHLVDAVRAWLFVYTQTLRRDTYARQLLDTVGEWDLRLDPLLPPPQHHHHIDPDSPLSKADPEGSYVPPKASAGSVQFNMPHVDVKTCVADRAGKPAAVGARRAKHGGVHNANSSGSGSGKDTTRGSRARHRAGGGTYVSLVEGMPSSTAADSAAVTAVEGGRGANAIRPPAPTQPHAAVRREAAAPTTPADERKGGQGQEEQRVHERPPAPMYPAVGTAVPAGTMSPRAGRGRGRGGAVRRPRLRTGAAGARSTTPPRAPSPQQPRRASIVRSESDGGRAASPVAGTPQQTPAAEQQPQGLNAADRADLQRLLGYGSSRSPSPAARLPPALPTPSPLCERPVNVPGGAPAPTFAAAPGAPPLRVWTTTHAACGGPHEQRTSPRPPSPSPSAAAAARPRAHMVGARPEGGEVLREMANLLCALSDEARPAGAGEAAATAQDSNGLSSSNASLVSMPGMAPVQQPAVPLELVRVVDDPQPPPPPVPAKLPLGVHIARGGPSQAAMQAQQTMRPPQRHPFRRYPEKPV